MKVTYDPHLLGPAGEQIAADYLANQGFHIIERNYRSMTSRAMAAQFMGMNGPPEHNDS